jgi:hypothetical protein
MRPEEEGKMGKSGSEVAEVSENSGMIYTRTVSSKCSDGADTGVAPLIVRKDEKIERWSFVGLSRWLSEVPFPEKR